MSLKTMSGGFIYGKFVPSMKFESTLEERQCGPVVRRAGRVTGAVRPTQQTC